MCQAIRKTRVNGKLIRTHILGRFHKKRHSDIAFEDVACGQNETEHGINDRSALLLVVSGGLTAALCACTGISFLNVFVPTIGHEPPTKRRGGPVPRLYMTVFVPCSNCFIRIRT